MVKILVVEDEPIVALELVQELMAAGYHVLGPVSSLTSVVELAAFAPDVALVDINVDGTPLGLTIAKVLAFEFKTPVLFLTGHKQKACANRDLAVGLIAKPVRSDRVVACVDAYTRLARGEYGPRPCELELFSGPSSGRDLVAF